MKRGVAIVILIFFIIPFAFAQSLTLTDLFDSRVLSYSSDKVMVPTEGVFQVTEDVVSQASATGAVTFYYIGDTLVATSDPLGLSYNHINRIGSDIASKSLPFGEPLNIENMFSFTGKEYDQNLYYFGARYYDPNLGRFISTDPVKENHPYAYVNNNPLNLVDPDGKEEVRYIWTRPTTGSPVEFYVGQGQFAQGPYTPMGNFDMEEAVLNIPDPLLATGFGFRVAGVDSLNRQGPWSETSEEYFGQVVSGVSDDNIRDFSKYGALPPSYPNPASDRTTISYYVPYGDTSQAKLAIYDVRGALVKEIEVESYMSGWHEYEWDLKDRFGRDVAAGTYIMSYKYRYHFEGTITDDEGNEITKQIFTEQHKTMKLAVVK